MLIDSLPANPPAGKTPMTANAIFQTIVGPTYNGVMRGVQWMEVGFIQQVMMVQESGTYYTYSFNKFTGMLTINSGVQNQLVDPATYRQDKKWHIDGIPNTANLYTWLDTVTGTDPNHPAVPANAFVNFNNSPGSINNAILNGGDDPKIYGAPSIFATSKNTGYILTYVDITAKFNLSIAVATTKLDDPVVNNVAGQLGTDGIYTARETAAWNFNGSGGVQEVIQQLGKNSYDFNYFATVYNAAARAGLTPQNENFAADGKAIPIPPGPSMNSPGYKYKFQASPPEPLH